MLFTATHALYWNHQTSFNHRKHFFCLCFMFPFNKGILTLRCRVTEHVCLLFLRLFSTMCVLIRKHYRSPVRLFIFGKMSYAVRLLDPVWKLSTSEHVGVSIRVTFSMKEKMHCEENCFKIVAVSRF